MKGNNTLYFPVRVLYILGVVIVSLFIFSFLWYLNTQIFTEFQSVGTALMTDLSTNSTTSDLVDTFFSNVNAYVLIIALTGLSIWAWQYSQKRGRRL